AKYRISVSLWNVAPSFPQAQGPDALVHETPLALGCAAEYEGREDLETEETSHESAGPRILKTFTPLLRCEPARRPSDADRASGNSKTGNRKVPRLHLCVLRPQRCV
ncbi:MAG: hypothetical protein WA644_03210, partial [Candidatus Acidiferrales bacterium]